MARIGLSHVGLVRTCMISPTEVGETGAGERPWSDVRIRTPTERAAPKAALTRRPAPVLPVGASEIGPGHDAFPSPGRCRAEAGHGPGAPLRIRYRMSPPALWMRSGSYPYLVPIQPKGGVLVSPQEAGFPFAADTRCHSCRHPARAYIEALLAAGCHYRQVRVLLAAMGLWAPSVRCHDGGSPGTARPGGSPSRLVRPADPRRGPRAEPVSPGRPQHRLHRGSGGLVGGRRGLPQPVDLRDPAGLLAVDSAGVLAADQHPERPGDLLLAAQLAPARDRDRLGAPAAHRSSPPILAARASYLPARASRHSQVPHRSSGLASQSGQDAARSRL